MILWDRVRKAVEELESEFDNEIDIILDYCYDAYGEERALDKDEVKDLVKMLKNLVEI